jgi:hypothetical protein
VRDLRERDREHVVEHERHALGRGEGVEHDLEGEPHRLAQDRLLLGVARVRESHDGVRDVKVGQDLTPRPPGAQPVEADPPNDGREPRLHAPDGLGILVPYPEPRFLQCVVRLTD